MRHGLQCVLVGFDATDAPQEVSVQFLRNGAVYYESSKFSVVNDMKLQTFELPQPALFTGGEVRMRLIGRQQKQTVGTAPLPHFGNILNRHKGVSRLSHCC